MTTITFKADDKFKKTLEALARIKGINTSAYMKLILTQEMRKELAEVTANGMTVAEELAILDDAENGETDGPFETVDEMMNFLNKNAK